MRDNTDEIPPLSDLKERAKEDGKDQGRQAVENCEIAPLDGFEDWQESGDKRLLRDLLLEEAFRAEENSRQYSGHPMYEISTMPLMGHRMEQVEDAYEEGVRAGIQEGLEDRMMREIVQYRESLTTEDIRESIEETRGLEVHDELDPRYMLGHFEMYDPSLEDLREVRAIWQGEKPIEADYLYHKPDRSHATLQALSDALGHHGVESVRDGRGGEVLYEYANSGHSTIPEVFWSPHMEAWVFGDMETLATLGDPRLIHNLTIDVQIEASE
jgi:hypothetical protein